MGVDILASQFPNTLFDQGDISKFSSFELNNRDKYENKRKILYVDETDVKAIRCSMRVVFHLWLISNLFRVDYILVHFSHFFSLHYGETKLIQE